MRDHRQIMFVALGARGGDELRGALYLLTKTWVSIRYKRSQKLSPIFLI